PGSRSSPGASSTGRPRSARSCGWTSDERPTGHRLRFCPISPRRRQSILAVGMRGRSRADLNGRSDRAMIGRVVRRISSPVFVGRVQELALLDVALDAAEKGEPGIILVGGDAGIGKTRFATEFAATV